MVVVCVVEEQGSAPPVELPAVPQQNTIHTILTRYALSFL